MEELSPGARTLKRYLQAMVATAIILGIIGVYMVRSADKQSQRPTVAESFRSTEPKPTPRASPASYQP